MVVFVFFFKQKTAYEMRISDWSSDVCSSDLSLPHPPSPAKLPPSRGQKRGAAPCGPAPGMAPADGGPAYCQLAFSACRPALFRSFNCRSEERRVGKEGVSKCRSRWFPYN